MIKIKSFVKSLILGLAFIISFCVYTLDKAPNPFDFSRLIFPFILFSSCVFLLFTIKNKLTPKRENWIYIAIPLLMAGTGHLLSPASNNTFYFIEPETRGNNIFPPGGPNLFSNVKLLLNGESRWASPLGAPGLMKYNAVVPDYSYLIFGVGIISDDSFHETVKLHLFITGEDGKKEQLNLQEFSTDKHSWFDVSIDMTKWHGQKVTIELTTDSSYFMLDWNNPVNLFLTPPRFIENNPDVSPKNVILVVVDSLRYDAVTHSEGNGHTPNLYRRVQENGVDFSRHYAQSSWTCTSVASLFTSRMPIQTGVVSLHARFLPDKEKTLMETTKDLGYVSAGFSANNLISGINNFDQGMDMMTYVGLNDKFTNPHQGWSNSGERMGEETLSWIKANKDFPFIVYMHYQDTHYPYWPPLNKQLETVKEHGIIDYVRNWRSILDCIDSPALHLDESAVAINRALYKKEVEYWDEAFDAFLNKLEEIGVMDDTVIIITSDHGEEFLEHDFAGHGHALFEEQIHVPLAILNYEKARVKNVDAITQNLDIMPTVAGILDFPENPAIQGETLLNLMEDKNAVRKTVTAFSELPAINTPYGMLSYKRYRYQRACITKNSKLIEKGSDQYSVESREYFRLDTNPMEDESIRIEELHDKDVIMEIVSEFYKELPGQQKVHPPVNILPENKKFSALRSVGYIDNVD